MDRISLMSLARKASEEHSRAKGAAIHKRQTTREKGRVLLDLMSAGIAPGFSDIMSYRDAFAASTGADDSIRCARYRKDRILRDLGKNLLDFG